MACTLAVLFEIRKPNLRQSVNESDDDVLDVDVLMQIAASVEEDVESAEMEFVGENLDDALHQVFLGDWIATIHDLVERTKIVKTDTETCWTKG